MEKEKYYTPTIEEFHVGFEFEMSDSCPDTGQNMWYESTFGNLLIKSSGGQYSISLKDYVEYIKNEEVRVKYLDREDIESFGFKLSEKENRLYYEYVLGHDSLFIDKNNTVNIFIENSNSDTIFDGKIKNKSEFSRLLKQLSII